MLQGVPDVPSSDSNKLMPASTSKSPPRPRTRPPEVRRNELMGAAQHLFLEYGVAAATIEQITAAAAVAKGTFFLYLSSKEDILAALGDRYGEEHLERIKSAVAEKSEKDWEGKLAAWARTCVSGYVDSIQLHDILFYGSRPPTREGLVNNIAIDHLCDLLRCGVKAQAWSIDDPRSTAVFLFSGLHGVVDEAHLKQKRINRSRLARTAERLCFRVVGLSTD